MWPLNEAAGRRQSPSVLTFPVGSGWSSDAWLNELASQRSEIHQSGVMAFQVWTRESTFCRVFVQGPWTCPFPFRSGAAQWWVVYRDKPARSVALATPVSRGVCCPSSHKLENYHCEIWAEISSERTVVQPDRGVEEQRWEVWWDANLQTCWAQHETPIRSFGSSNFGSKVKFYGIN